MKTFRWTFQELLTTHSAIKSEISVKKSLSDVEKSHFVKWDIFEPPGIAKLLHMQSSDTEYFWQRFECITAH